MRKAGLGYIAVALALVVVFAPRPWGADDASGKGGDGGLLISRALAPTIDAVDVREQESARSTRAAAPTLWMVCLLAIIVGGLHRKAFFLIDPPSRRRLVVGAGTRGCRAPPLSLV
jgi:hypothetical protein